MMSKKKTPEVIEDSRLEDASGGGIAILLPAVQKVRDAAATSSTTDSTLIQAKIDKTTPKL